VGRKLHEAAGTQTSVASECAKAAETLQAVLEEMVYNRLGTGEEHRQINDGVVQPLRDLAGPLAKASAALNQARSLAEAGPLRDQVHHIGQVQQDALKQMRVILKQMHKLESRQDMINTLRMILRWSERQLENIEKKRDSELERIFEDASQEKQQSQARPAREEPPS